MAQRCAGTGFKTTQAWFDAVKWFRHGGWSLAGNAGARGGLYRLLTTVLMMREDDAFATGQDWVHVLGISTLDWAVVLTAVQKGLRVSNPGLSVSFDSSSPFQIAGRNEQACYLPELGTHVSSWKIRMDQSPQGEVFVDSEAAFPYSSPLGQCMTLGDLNVYQGLYQKRRYDPISLPCWSITMSMCISKHLTWPTMQHLQPIQSILCQGYIGNVLRS